MIPEQWNKIVELFHAAREKAGGERVALLDSVCSDDSLLRQAVEQMLQDYEESGSFLRQPKTDDGPYRELLPAMHVRCTVRNLDLLTNDAPIAMSARRLGLRVITRQRARLPPAR